MEPTKRPEFVFSAAFLAERLRDGLKLPPRCILAIAFSGGLDSTVLLHALARLRTEYPLTLSAIHIDHGLHLDSARWAEQCRHVCQGLDIPFRVQRVQVADQAADGLEAAARRARYAAIAELLPADAALVTAHHADDQAETLLLQILRGAGVAGLAAMAWQRRAGSYVLLRPLLDVPRAALLAYAHEHQLSWIDDPSNQNIQLRRNFLRADIFPRLEEQWPGARAALVRTASHAAEAQALLEEMAAADLSACCALAVTNLALSVPAVQRLSAPRRRNLLRFWLRQQHVSAPETRKLEELLGLLAGAPRSRHACVLSGGTAIWRYRDQLVAVPDQSAPPVTMDVSWNPSVPIHVTGAGLLRAEQAQGEGVSCARLKGGLLRIRMRRGGEQIKLPGRRHHHALKKLLQGAGVPPWERARIPLLFLENRLVAVANRWVDQEFVAAPREAGLKIVWTPFPSLEKSA